MNLTVALRLVLLGVAAALRVSAQGGSPDPAFATIPFDRWLAEGEQGHYRWTARVSLVELSLHQRLRARVEIQIDGNELVRRRGQGELVIFVQFKDSENRAYQTHTALELPDVEEAASKSNIVYTHDAFVLPGEYRLSFVIFHTVTGEHSAMQRMLRVAALKNDPLPAAWRDLPPVEIFRDPPGDLFLPSMTGRLHLPLDTRRPIRVELLMNASRSAADVGPRSRRPTNSNPGELIPALKAISQVEVRNGTMNVALLDLTRRQVIFEQDSRGGLDWPELQTALKAADPNVIDVHSLENRRQNAQFFLAQVHRRIFAAGPSRVLIVLSEPMAFSSGEDLHRIDVSDKPDGKIYFIRYHSVAGVAPAFPTRRGLPFPTRPGLTEPPDSLEPMLKPLQPRLFDVYTPEQFRKALGNLLAEISRM